MSRLLRLSLFQVTVGMALVLVNGTLNRIMIVDLARARLARGAVMIALPLVFAPFRALLGFDSDTHRSLLGWKRVPYIWFGTLLQFGGLAIMPFALILLSGDSACAADRRTDRGCLGLSAGRGRAAHDANGGPRAARPISRRTTSARSVVALLCVMLLLGMIGQRAWCSARLLSQFQPDAAYRSVVQGAALATMVLRI